MPLERALARPGELDESRLIAGDTFTGVLNDDVHDVEKHGVRRRVNVSHPIVKLALRYVEPAREF